MNERLKQKCLFVSIAMHGLLLVVVLVASAFKSEVKDPVVKPMTVIDVNTINRLLAPAAPDPAPSVPKAPAPPEVEEPKPAPKPAPKPPPKKPDPPKPKPVIKKPDPPKPKPVIQKTSKAPKKPPTKTKSKPKPKPRPRPTIDTSALKNIGKRNNQAAQRRERERQEQQRKAAAALEARRVAALKTQLKSATSLNPTTSVNVRSSGSSARAAANYGAYVLSTYDRHWREPSSLSKGTKATITVTIRRDGSVRSARISSRSGVSPMDKSVQSLIDKVRKFKPFPSDMTDSEKTFTLDLIIK